MQVVVIVCIYNWTLILLPLKATITKKRHVPPFTIRSFIFTSGTPSLGLPGSVCWTTPASAPPHLDGPHPEAPSSQNSPPAETPSAHPSEQLASTLAPEGWFQMAKQQRPNTKLWESPLLRAPGWWLFLDCGSDSCPVLIRQLNHMFCMKTHPRHTHTHNCLHLIVSPKIRGRVQHSL